MNIELMLAKRQLTEDHLTCAIRKDGAVFTSTERGVKPLLGFLDEGLNLFRAYAADHVVGNGAAYLYVLLKVRAVYADVMSRPALETLNKFGIEAEYGELVDHIRNRKGDGVCPIEEAVAAAKTPTDALRRIRIRLAELNASF